MLHFNIYNMATFKVLLHSSNRRKDGTYPVSLRIIKNMKAKYISLGLYSKKEEWDVIGERFRCDKRVCPNYKEFNARIVQLLARAQEVERHFEFDRIDWTLNQFEDAFLYKDKKGKFLDFALLCIKDMKETGHIGNAKVWEKVICNMKLFDKKLSTRYFQEIDIKYVSAYNSFMEKKGWCGNTRKHDMKKWDDHRGPVQAFRLWHCLRLWILHGKPPFKSFVKMRIFANGSCSFFDK